MRTHEPVVGPKVNDSPPRLAADVLEAFRRAYLCSVADAVGPFYSMDQGIRPLYEPESVMVGQALTVKAVPGDNLAVHGALTMVQPGDVLVIDWRGFAGAGACGAGSVVMPKRRGLAGIVVDGAYRDVDEMRTIGVPLYARGVNPASPAKSRVGEINVPVSCGGVVVQPGDLVMGTAEGVVVVPADEIPQILETLEEYERPTGLDYWDRGEREARYELRGQQYRLMLDNQLECTRRRAVGIDRH
ncbi:RraA family protein [Dactylosporangium sp. CS-033363]|uniref:RraA family protein n=1 Tax=Dactylosporangium sp. CS-033363 TaxID=3239935 RepID=UPI003D91496F